MMVRVALRRELKLGKDEKSSAVACRVDEAFAKNGVVNPTVYFHMLDGSWQKVSSVDRVVKRYPELARFDYTTTSWGVSDLERQIGNELHSPLPGEPIDLATLVEILAGIPRSYPFFAASLRFAHPAFGTDEPGNLPRDLLPGVVLEDKWGNTRRTTSLKAVIVVEADAAADALPAPPAHVSGVLECFGKAASAEQILVPGQMREVANAVAAIEADTKGRMAGIVDRARLPHRFFEENDIPTYFGIGPLKPMLVQVFRPLGYQCRGGGMMILLCSRRTALNYTVQLYLDLGSRGDKVHPSYKVGGLGFKFSLALPVTPHSLQTRLHYLTDADRWRQIVESLAALVAELDRTVLPAIEAAAGRSPVWYRPETSG